MANTIDATQGGAHIRLSEETVGRIWVWVDDNLHDPTDQIGDRRREGTHDKNLQTGRPPGPAQETSSN